MCSVILICCWLPQHSPLVLLKSQDALPESRPREYDLEGPSTCPLPTTILGNACSLRRQESLHTKLVHQIFVNFNKLRTKHTFIKLWLSEIVSYCVKCNLILFWSVCALWVKFNMQTGKRVFSIAIKGKRPFGWRGFRQAKQTPWPESASELYRPCDRRLSEKLVPTFADRGVSRSQCGGPPTAVISGF
jgi:hypothetical protein